MHQSFIPRRILLSLNPSMVSQLDQAAHALNLCRSDIIRRSLARDLEFVLTHEVARAQQHQQGTASSYQEWLNTKMFRG